MDIQLLLEAERRGILPPDKKALLAEARRRGLIGGAPTPEASVPPKDGPGFFGGIAKGTEALVSSARTALGSVFGSPEEAAEAGLERQQAIGEKYGEGLTLDKLKQIYAERGLLPAAGEVIAAVPDAIGEQLPNIGASVAGARVGSRFGLPGAIVGAAAPSFTQMFGSNIERQASEQEDIDVGRAALTAVPQAALDVAAQTIPLGRSVAGKLFGKRIEELLARGSDEAAEALANESLTTALLKGTAMGAVAEVPTEVTQQALERWQAGLPLTSEDALKEYGDTAFQVSLLAPIGAAGRVVDRAAARNKATAADATEDTLEEIPYEDIETPGAAPIPAAAATPAAGAVPPTSVDFDIAEVPAEEIAAAAAAAAAATPTPAPVTPQAAAPTPVATPRPLEEIDAEITQLQDDVDGLTDALSEDYETSGIDPRQAASAIKRVGARLKELAVERAAVLAAQPVPQAPVTQPTPQPIPQAPVAQPTPQPVAQTPVDLAPVGQPAAPAPGVQAPPALEALPSQELAPIKVPPQRTVKQVDAQIKRVQTQLVKIENSYKSINPNDESEGTQAVVTRLNRDARTLKDKLVSLQAERAKLVEAAAPAAPAPTAPTTSPVSAAAAPVATPAVSAVEATPAAPVNEVPNGTVNGAAPQEAVSQPVGGGAVVPPSGPRAEEQRAAEPASEGLGAPATPVGEPAAGAQDLRATLTGPVVTLPDGGAYSGELDSAGRATGTGVYVDPDGYRYEGNFIEGMLSGRGTLTSPDGVSATRVFPAGEVEVNVNAAPVQEAAPVEGTAPVQEAAAPVEEVAPIEEIPLAEPTLIERARKLVAQKGQLPMLGVLQREFGISKEDAAVLRNQLKVEQSGDPATNQTGFDSAAYLQMLRRLEEREDSRGSTKRKQQGEITPEPAPTGNELSQQELINAVNGKTMLQALDLIINTSSNPAYRQIATKLRPLLRAMLKSGVLMNTPVQIAKQEDGAKGSVIVIRVRDDARGTDRIGVKFELDPDTATYSTLMHELLHAISMPIRQLGQTAKARRKYGELTRITHDYEAITDHIGNTLMKYAGNENLARQFLRDKNVPLEKRNLILESLRLARDTNVFKFEKKNKNKIIGYDRDEVFAWALTDDALSLVIDTFVPPIKKANKLVKAVSEFIDVLRRMLGLDPSTTSAFNQVFGIVEALGDNAQILADQGSSLGVILPLDGIQPTRKNQQAAPKRVKAPPRKPRSVEQMVDEGVESLIRTTGRSDPSLLQRILSLMNYKGYSLAVTTWQNSRRALKELQDSLELAGKLIIDLDKDFNNFYDHISAAAARAQNIILARFSKRFNRQSELVQAFAKKRGITEDEAMALIDRVMKALHAPERRRMLYLRTVPLNNTNLAFTVTEPDGTSTKVTAAQLRERIFKRLYEKTGKLSDQERDTWYKQIEKYRDILLKVTDPKGAYVDPKGVSMEMTNASSVATTVPGKDGVIDINDAYYDVLGDFMPEEIDKLEKEYRAHKADYDPIIKTVQEIIKSTRRTDTDSNYWTQGVDNVVEFYGWKNYVPLKSEPNSKLTKASEDIEPRGPITSPEFSSDVQSEPFGGRKSDSTNVLMQVQRDAIKASLRLGQARSRAAVRNAINQKIISADPPTIIPLSERATQIKDVLRGGNNQFIYYAEDGSIEVYKINDVGVREAIRKSYEEDSLTKRLQQFLNKTTSMISRGYTFYNPAFAPKDFFRNVFTNAGIVFIEKGASAFTKYSWMVAQDVARAGPFKGMKLAYLYEKGEFDAMRKLAESDPQFYKPAYEYLMNGGQTTYAQAVASQGKLEEIHREYLRDPANPKTALRWLRQWFSYWANGFELASRIAVYRIRKQELVNKNVDEASAQVSATAYAKGMANFEEIGTRGQLMGALYMFSRPSATGAVRALDAVAPAIVSTFGDYKVFLDRLPDSIKSDPAALARAKKEIDARARNAGYTALTFAAAGFMLYMMARSMYGEDDEEENLVATDNKELWTRNLRIPLKPLGLSDDPKAVFQLPWGFGLGAFMAGGAQFAAVATEDISPTQLFGNLTTINLDSFLPLPVARFNPLEPPEGLNELESTFFWVGDSIMPSAGRPLLEYFANINSLGHRIYKNTSNKYGDAYVSSENVPEIYNDLVKVMEENLRVDVKAEGLYYFVNTYMGGMNSLAAPAYGLALTAAGDKKIDLKRDLFVTSGFLGNIPNIDAARYAKAERELREIEQEISKVTGLISTKPHRFSEYMEENPLDMAAAEYYRKVKPTIDKLQSYKNLVRSGQYGELTAKERKELLEAYDAQINLHKRMMVETYNELMKDQGKKPIR